MTKRHNIKIGHVVAVGVVLGIVVAISAQETARGEKDVVETFRCELEQALYTRVTQKTLDYSTGHTESDTNDRLWLSIRVHGPNDIKLRSSDFDHAKFRGTLAQIKPSEVYQPTPILTQVANEKDQALDRSKLSLTWEGRERNLFQYLEEDSPKGGRGIIMINGLKAAGATKKLSVLKGTLWLPVIDEEEKVEVKPLADHLNKAVVLPSGTTVIFTLLHNDKVHYTIKSDVPDYHAIEIDYYDSADKKFDRGGYSLNYGSNELKCEASLGNAQAFPPGAYAVIRYPKKMRVLKVPFEFTDIELPNNGIKADQ